MGDWVVGAFINLFGSIAINFGTNLLKLGHTERERCVLDSNGTNGKLVMKPIVHFQTWRVGILVFAFGNCLNFISFGYAAQSLLAALGSVQFISNIVFARFVLCKRVSFKVLAATTFIVLGNIFLVAFGNHQSPVYTPNQLSEKYGNTTFGWYCFILMIIVAIHHYIYRRGELLIAVSGHEFKSYWHTLLPFSYAVVSGAVGSCSVLFAKSLSNLLRLAMSGGYQLHTLFTYSLLLLFLSTAGFWMARLNEGLALFDAILIVPMFQIAWAFFSICTGIVYFQEYQVFNTVRTTMFVLGMMFVFIGISLLSPDEDPKGAEVVDNSLDSITCSNISSEWDRLVIAPEETQITANHGAKAVLQKILIRATDLMAKGKSACFLSYGLGEVSSNASSVLVMPMVSSKISSLRGSSLVRETLVGGAGSFSMRRECSKLLETRPKDNAIHAGASIIIVAVCGRLVMLLQHETH